MFSDGPRLYQPHITRLPSLLSLLTITLALIAVIEIACRRLPARESDYIDSPINLKRSRDLDVRKFARNDLAKLQNATLSNGVAISSPNGNTGPTDDGKVIQTQPSVQPSPAVTPLSTKTAISSNYLPIISDSSTPSTVPSSDYLSITTPVTPPKIYSTADLSNYLPVSDQSISSAVLFTSDFLPVGTTAPAVTTKTAIPSNYLDVASSITPPIIYSTANPTDYLPVQGSSSFLPTASNELSIEDNPTPSRESYVIPPNFLPVNPTPVSTTTAAARPSDYLEVTPSITPPIIYSTANPSDYLPVQASSSFSPTASNELSVGDDATPSIASYVIPPNFLPVGPVTPTPTNFVVIPSNDLPINDKNAPVGPTPLSRTTAAARPSDYLEVTPSITPPIIYSTALPSDYLPVEPPAKHSDPSSASPLPNPSDYLPVLPSDKPGNKEISSNPHLTTPSESFGYVMTKSLFLPVGSDSASNLPTQSAFLPIDSHGEQLPPGISQTVGFLPLTAFLPVFQNGNTKTANKPNGAPSEPTPNPLINSPAGITGSRGPIIQYPQTGIFQGEPYSKGADGVIVIGGKSFMANSPTTATLANGKVVIMGPSGVSFQDAPDVTLAAGIVKPANVHTTGVFQGESYVIESNGVLVIGEKTFAAASPTTATLANGKVVIMGPSGVSFQDAPDVTLAAGFIKSANVPATGVFHGESYIVEPSGVLVIGGKTFAAASPTTATLADGKTIIIGPDGASFQDAPGVTLPVEVPNSATPPPRTGSIQGESYSIGSNGVVVIGGKTLSVASPTTATLPDGKIVIVGPSGISVQDGHSIGIAESVTMPPRTGTFKGEPYTIGSDGMIVIGGKSFATALPTTATLNDGKIVVVGPSGISIQDALNNTTPLKTYVTPYEYVVGGILPTVVAVIFSIPWQLLALAVKEIQPFYQLQHPDGATAQDSIGLDYRYSVNAIATITAIRKGHYLVWWTGLISMAILFVAPLATGTIFIGFTGLCTATSGRKNCFPKLSVYPLTARILQALLGFIAILTFFLAIAMLRKRSGVFANPLSIAALATLFQNQQVIEDFRRLNPFYTDTKMIRAALRENRYQIGPYLDHEGMKCYGLTKCHDDHALMDPNYQTSFRKGQKYASVSVRSVEDHQRPKKKISLTSLFIHPAAIIIFAIFVAGLQVLIIYYNQTGGNTGFERWMDSQSFGVSFLFTAVGVILKMYWSLLDEETRNMEPYRQLLTSGAKAGDSILLSPHSNPYTGIFYSFRNRHFFNTYLSLVAILCEPLIVALADIPFRAGSVFTAYRVSTYISIGVLSMMLIGIIWMLCRKRTPELIRRPDTVASVLLFLCGSSMLEDFKGMSQMSRKQRDAIVKCWDKNYAMGSVIGVDGVEREGIDESLFVTAQTKED